MADTLRVEVYSYSTEAKSKYTQQITINSFYSPSPFQGRILRHNADNVYQFVRTQMIK